LSMRSSRVSRSLCLSCKCSAGLRLLLRDMAAA